MIDDEEANVGDHMRKLNEKTFTMNDISAAIPNSNNPNIMKMKSMNKNGDETEQEDINKILRVPNNMVIKRPGQMAPMPGSIMNKGLISIANDDKPEGMPMKYSDYIKQEKLRKFKRLPRLIGQRGPVKFTCPSCNRDGETSTTYEVTGGQICCAVSMCWCCCYAACCACLIPFCCCCSYNVRHSCPKCYHQLGESGK